MIKYALFIAAFCTLVCLNSYAGDFPTTIDGRDLVEQKSMKFTAIAEKPLVVIFLSAKCPCSNSHLKEINSLATEFKDFTFVGIHSNADEDKKLAKDYFTMAGLSFPIISDSEFKWANQFKALKTPHSFVVTTAGDAVYRGGVSDSSDCGKAGKLLLRAALNDIKEHRPVKVAVGRALGCNISRGEKNVW